MDKAFDSKLQDAVKATEVAKKSVQSSEDRFRYQCLCCGENVYLVAADSSKRKPHFKHRMGNNDTICERYLGQPGMIEQCTLLRKQKKEHIGFYFNEDRKTFEVGVIFFEEELSLMEKEQNSFSIAIDHYTEPFLEVPINRKNFISGNRNYFTITQFSTDYLVSYNNSGVDYCIYEDVMKDSKKINIFRVNEKDEHCKLHKTSLLYTDTKYIAISENEESVRKLASLPDMYMLNDVETFETEGKVFWKIQFCLCKVNYSTCLFFQQYGYQIEKLETFRILWPFVYKKDSCFVCTEDAVYVYSSFELVPHGNINIDAAQICKVEENIFKIYINDNKVFICEKNISMNIQREKEDGKEEHLEEIEISNADKIRISDKYDCYLFDKYGCTKLATGTTVYLSSTDKIIGYKNGHVRIFIYSIPKKKIDTQQIINNALKYHPQSETFKSDEFMDVMGNESVIMYLESCYRSGKINTVLKYYIKEGLI